MVAGVASKYTKTNHHTSGSGMSGVAKFRLVFWSAFEEISQEVAIYVQVCIIPAKRLSSINAVVI